jgi:hypothetical protein
VVRRFPILFTGFNKAMVVLGIRRSASYVEIDDDALRVRMAWAFHLVAPRSSVRSATPGPTKVWGWGVHGWRGRWLVNGSSKGIVRLALDPPARGWVVGFPVRVHTLDVSLEDPDALLRA